eukprot:1868661-Rhodomonas_salina.2
MNFHQCYSVLSLSTINERLCTCCNRRHSPSEADSSSRRLSHRDEVRLVASLIAISIFPHKR